MHGNQLFFDRCLAFGNRASAGIFCRLADLITWIAVKHGIPAIIHYVDDFLLVVKASRATARKVLNLFISIGMPYKREKLEGPDTVIT